MSRVSLEHLDSESCSRALSQARMYLEQIRSRVSPGGPDVHGTGKRDYLVDAAKQIHLALERDVSEDYEEAFNHYKNGVDVLLSGVQVDPNKERREAVKRKITQYLKRAEEIFNCHLQRTLGNESSTATGYSSLRFRPIRTLSSAVENLRRWKVVGVIEKVQLVQDPATGGTFILKSLPKSHVETRERQTIIPHGVPFMAKLLRYYASEDSIFLHLEHVQGGTLWSHLRSRPRLQQGSSDGSRSLHLQPSSALGGHGEEQRVPGAGSWSSQSPSFCPENGSDLPISANHHPLEIADQSSPRVQSSAQTDPRRERPCRFHTGPANGPRGVTEGKDLSTTHIRFAVTDSVFMAMAKGCSHLTNQSVAFQSCDLLTSSDGVSRVSETEAPRQDPRILTGERLPQSPAAVLKAIGRGNPMKVEPRVCQVSEAPWAQPTQPPVAPPGQRQLHPGTTLHCSNESNRSGSGGQEPLRSISRAQEGAGYGQHRELPTAGQHGPLASRAFQGDGQGTWAVNEELIRLWAAEILLALEGLHQQGVLCQDLNPRNLLLDGAGHIRLTFFGQWTEVEPQCCSQALEDMYSAPEVGGISELTEACDWWSFGSLLYELLTGRSLSQSHPSGIHPHTQLHLPERLSLPAASLLTELLQFDPKRRLGSGRGGVNKLKSHPFFSTVPWNKLVG
ncbi:ribosomal protein S6 kinase-like 1 [Emydura macquarii macquarii]|uniref:ribosomal protein S6 kinase-like 1 n=1 Tax=Emydura macquarii macquarii TaxID=1129001 RepID=UPI00352AAB9A